MTPGWAPATEGTSAMTDTVRKTPCASCPYRRDVPSGIWSAEEYDKLLRYDGSISEQAVSGGLAPFSCHQADGKLCAGWAGHRDPVDLIALRIAVSVGKVDPSALVYETRVPLFASGAEAAEHGRRDIETPGPSAVEQAGKITRVRGRRGQPVTGEPGDC